MQNIKEHMTPDELAAYEELRKAIEKKSKELDRVVSELNSLYSKQQDMLIRCNPEGWEGGEA